MKYVDSCRCARCEGRPTRYGVRCLDCFRLSRLARETDGDMTPASLRPRHRALSARQIDHRWTLLANLRRHETPGS